MGWTELSPTLQHDSIIRHRGALSRRTLRLALRANAPGPSGTMAALATKATADKDLRRPREDADTPEAQSRHLAPHLLGKNERAVDIDVARSWKDESLDLLTILAKKAVGDRDGGDAALPEHTPR